MQIVENLAEWSDKFELNWLKQYQETGQTNWKVYNRARNTSAPGLPGIDLAQSRIMLISTAGGYLATEQAPFDAPNLLGDYTVRLLPSATPFAEIAYAHEHYNHTAVDSDPQVLLPLKHLQALANEGIIGGLHPTVISFHGYQPDVRCIVNEFIPAAMAHIEKEKVDGVLLIPA